MMLKHMLHEAPCDHRIHHHEKQSGAFLRGGINETSFSVKKRKLKQQGYLALSLPETLSNPFSEQRQALGKVLEIIYRTDLHQDLVMLCDLFISLSSRLTMLRMLENLRNLSK